MPILAALALSVSGCVNPPTTLSGLTSDATSPRAAILVKLAAACPTPTRWTLAQRRAVGDYMIAHADDPAMGLLAPEWERLDAGARACRGAR